jgi:hypothetical protein
LTVLEGVWMIFGYTASFTAPGISCPAGGCLVPSTSPYLSIVGVALALIILIVGGLGIWGASFAYVGGAALSAVALFLWAYEFAVLNGSPYFAPEIDVAAIGAALSLVGLIGNVLGMRSRSRLSEQANPMNLPVFG